MYNQPHQYPAQQPTYDPLAVMPSPENQNPQLLYMLQLGGHPCFTYGLREAPRIFSANPNIVNMLTQVRMSQDYGRFVIGSDVWNVLQAMRPSHTNNPSIEALISGAIPRIPTLIELIAHIANVYICQTTLASVAYITNKQKAIESAIYGVAAEMALAMNVVAPDPQIQIRNQRAIVFMWAHIGGLLVTQRLPLNWDVEFARKLLTDLRIGISQPYQPMPQQQMPMSPPPSESSNLERAGLYGLNILHRSPPPQTPENNFNLTSLHGQRNQPEPPMVTAPVPPPPKPNTPAIDQGVELALQFSTATQLAINSVVKKT